MATKTSQHRHADANGAWLCRLPCLTLAQELIPVIQAEHLAQLVQRPGGARISCGVAVDQAMASMLDDHEHVQRAETRGKARQNSQARIP